jgi:hypothetical protein
MPAEDLMEHNAIDEPAEANADGHGRAKYR